MEHHGKGEKDIAIKLYKEFMSSGGKDKRAFTNLAALLRGEGEAEEAMNVACKGLNEMGKDSPILLNTLGNCLRDLNRNSEAIAAYRQALKHHKGYFEAQISIVGALHDMGLKKLSDMCLLNLFKFYGISKYKILSQIITREVENSNLENRPINKSLEIVIEYADKSNDKSEESLANHWFALSQLCCHTVRLDDAVDYYGRGVKLTKQKIQTIEKEDLKLRAREIYTIASWNFACQLLKHGNMELGWKLYDHGLNTPAEGAQKWQRALFKPFTHSKVKPWKGENLSNKTILLLGEQGIGDTMAFATLIEPIIKMAKEVHLIVPQRLHAIYKRSFKTCKVYSDKDVRDNSLDEKLFDYQCALGSIPQYIYKDVTSFKRRSFCVEANTANTQYLKNKYLQKNKKIIIGISWQGGGRKDRLRDKSIDLGKLLTVLKPYNIKILSLQYGDDHKVVNEAAKRFNVDFVDDQDIQATKDMDTWLDQVNACDGIISIANTTIHGAGSLQKPTLCLLGARSDWRWLSDRNEKFSYWYPSVEIAWQEEENKDWTAALERVEAWLRQEFGPII